MKSGAAASLPIRSRELPHRIVFQLDVSLDTLHYSIWTNAIHEDRHDETIREFRKALHQCRIVHPDDVHAFEQFIQTKADISTISQANIRLFTGSAHYDWYRLYIVAPENLSAHGHTISGVLESLQAAQGDANRSRERLHQDALFREAITGNAILSLGFHDQTGERLVSDHDVLPRWLPENIRWKELAHILRDQIVFPENPRRIEDLLIPENPFMESCNRKPFFRDCRLPDLTKETEEIRWYRIAHAFIRETSASSACFYLTVMDIHEEKMREQFAQEAITFDQTTGMLRRCAFEHQVTEWLEHVRSEASYACLCAVVIVIDHAVDAVTQRGRDYVLPRVRTLGKTIQAFIHAHEMCGRYGFARFAMVLYGANTEILRERLKMLGMICRSLNSEWPDLQVRFGSHLELASQTEQGDVLLEKANQTLYDNENDKSRMNPPFTCEGQRTMAPPSERAGAGDQPQEALETHRKHEIFIRTFGHFDVFVDGEAVLFNHSKAKELLALLVDRRGGFVGATEAISCLWEEEPANSTTLSRCRKAALHLRQILLKYGIEYLLETVNGKRRIMTGVCECDYYQYLRHGPESSHQGFGPYMSEYSWAENSVANEQ